ncbi:hypothetical protein SAMN06295933_2345 [Desulfovibrio gilichinskyi]|uniref:Uncharacterized protein n=1 Tax=Desulfovibrio gilichinskyi TaxID=1519643 RepID=A0A1X7DY53_9BACT|nr:hypothetical protein [Desulfovibrio gilichinskyi]SMF23707.1 hypothetical protein SAMN06295933_2345 [Desulfovibrio gilichinskyi]
MSKWVAQYSDLGDEPCVSARSRCFVIHGQLVLNAFHAGQYRNGVIGQRQVGLLANGSGQRHNIIIGIHFDTIVLEIGLEDIGLVGGGLDPGIHRGSVLVGSTQNSKRYGQNQAQKIQ